MLHGFLPADLPADADHALVILVGVCVLGLMSTLTFSIKAWSQSRQANNAVNNIGPGEHRLYDRISVMAADIEHLRRIQEAFDAKGWQALPPEFGDGPSLTMFLRGVEQEMTLIRAKLEEHDAWEREIKHGEDPAG